MNQRDARRAFMVAAGTGIVLAACRKGDRATAMAAELGIAAGPASARSPERDSRPGGHDENREENREETGAVEDLMREHGVIRRVLVVYREAATRLRSNASSVSPEALQRAASLLRTFGEDYHERQLEEAILFPALKKAGGRGADDIDVLVAQHQRGRELTDYILGVTKSTIGHNYAGPLADVLEGFARMYEEHAAQEDTVVFPAWKRLLSPRELDAMGNRFEAIEQKTFGKDGFDDAVEQVSAIEKSLGIDLARMTPPKPPSAP